MYRKKTLGYDIESKCTSVTHLWFKQQVKKNSEVWF